MRIRSAALSLVLGLGMAVAAGGVAATPTVAAQGYTETGATSYTLDPAHGVLHVAVTVQIRNTTPSRVTATGTTVWYLRTATIWVENEARSIRATSGGTRLAVSSGSPGTFYRRLTVTYPNLYYGQSRTVLVAYDIPGGPPRSASSLRILRAFASFCVIANGVDSGTVRVSVPAGYGLEVTGSSLASEVRAGRRVFTSGRIADPSRYWTCFSGTDASGYRTQRLAVPGGRTILLESWPEDGSWAGAVKAQIDKGLPALVALIGRPLPGTAEIVVREQATGTEYAGFYDADTNTITVGEDFAQPSLVEHELAHAWFNLSAFSDRWLDEGSAEWAGRTTGGEEAACARPATGTKVMLSDWQFLTPKSTVADRDAVATQYETACYIVQAVADAAGPARTIAALDALFTGRDPYDPDASARRATTVATWRDWLDAMDELALAPAGAPANLASDLFLAYGVTPGGTILAQRTVARAAYHRLAAEVAGWPIPPAIHDPMAAWNFAAAGAAISAADLAWTLTGEADQALPGIDARHGPVATAWAAATTVKEITDAGKLAQAQLDAARDVAATETLAAAPLDLVAQLGLIGTSIPSLDPAVAAVRTGDTVLATRIAASVRDTIAGLSDAGLARLAALVGVVIGLVLLLLAVGQLRQRRSRGRAANVVVAATALVPAAPTPIADPASAMAPDATAAVRPEPVDPATDRPQPPPPPTG